MPVNAPMVLDFDICQENDCTSFDFTDATGVYSSSNSGGYGAPNFLVSDAISAYVNVTLPSGVQVSIQVDPTLPDDTGTIVWTVNSTDLGLTGSLPDGIYVIEYVINFNNSNSQTVQKTIVKTFLLSCTIKCCIQKMIAKIPINDCDCESKYLKNALLAFGLYQSLVYNGKCGNTTNTTSLLNRLTKLCNIVDCGCNS